MPARSAARSPASCSDNDHDVLLIDKDPRKVVADRDPAGASGCSATPARSPISSTASLEEYDVVVGATGDDKVNLVVSLLAKTEFSVRRVVARINHPANEWLFTEAWGVDVAVSTPRVLAALVEEAVEVGDLVRLFSFRERAGQPARGHVVGDCTVCRRPGQRPDAAGGRRAHRHRARRAGDHAAGRRNRWKPGTSSCLSLCPSPKERSGAAVIG